MKLSLKNIGKIGEASVEINGITVIAGENNTGKSTVGRALFAMFNSFYEIEQQIRAERMQNIETLVMMMYRSLTNRYLHRITMRRFNVEKIVSGIIDNIDFYKKDAEELKTFIVNEMFKGDESFIKDRDTSRVDEFIAQMMAGLNITDDDIFRFVLRKKLNAEFHGQVNNVFLENSGEIILSIKDQEMAAAIRDNEVKRIAGKMELHTECVYIDDPFILDEEYEDDAYDVRYLDHRKNLAKKFHVRNQANLIDEIIRDKKLEKIYSKLSDVCSGNIVMNKDFSLGYQRKNTDKVLAAKNLSTGFKTFAILKTLLQNGTIGYQGTIILDEPEIHLHPEWQLLFAELIVLLQKEFDVHILLNTHSPYFLNAIEVYSAKYGIDDRCKYYLASSEKDISYLEDVTDNIEKIYSKLAQPLQELENERYRL